MKETTLTKKYVFNGKVVNMRTDTAVTDDGMEVYREVVEHPGGVGIALEDEEGRFFMVKQYRYPHQRVMLEIPAGKLEKGEDHADCGRRELLEETGCTCSEYIYLGQVIPTPAYDSEVIHMYLAKGLTYSKQDLDEDEFLEVEKIPLAKAVKMVMNGEIADSKTQIGILKAYITHDLCPPL